MASLNGRSLARAIGALALLSGLAVGSPAEADPAPTGGGAEGPTPGWRQVSAGAYHTCGIRTSGRLFCWGDDSNGQLGDGGANTSQDAPVEVAGGATNWGSVDAGSAHTCARRTTGRLFCWGADAVGQLGDGGTNTPQATPRPVTGARSWSSVSAGGNHTCARATTGRLFCWGADGFGQLGDGGANTPRSVPRQVAGATTNWTAVTTGGDHTCARRNTGRLYCWGADGSGQLGDGGTDSERHVPREVAGRVTTWTSVSAGSSYTCARRTTSRLWCWGADNNGQLGNGGANTGRSAPVLVAGGFTDWVNVATGVSHTCGRRSTGQLFCWGYDFFGGLGDGLPLASQAAPVEVAGAGTDWAGASAGNLHTCGRQTTGRLFCWGYDAMGQLGDDGTTTDQPEPVEIV